MTRPIPHPANSRALSSIPEAIASLTRRQAYALRARLRPERPDPWGVDRPARTGIPSEMAVWPAAALDRAAPAGETGGADHGA